MKKRICQNKKIIAAVGICILTGSLCACGDDTGVVIAPLQELLESREEWAEEAENLFSENRMTRASEFCKDERDVVTVTISAAGDVSLGNYPEQDYYLSLPYIYEGLQEDAYFFENVQEVFFGDDMTIVNLEGGFTDAARKREGQTFCIKGKPEYVKALTVGSVEAVSMGNNHRLDYYQQGSDDTVATLESEGIAYAYDGTLGIYKTKGVRIGFVSVNEVSQGAEVERYLLDGIGKLKEEDVDIILACCHWGAEGQYFPEDYQRSLGRKCLDWGADLVIGHHPHVLQGVEEYQGKYIVYSLGNFCFGANKNPLDQDTVIFQQTFTFVEGDKQEETQIRLIPCKISSVKERNDFRPTPAAGEEGLRIIDKVNELSQNFGVRFDEEGWLY